MLPITLPHNLSLATLANHVDQSWFAALHHRYCACNRPAKLTGVCNWSLCMNAETLRDFGEINIWVGDGSRKMSVIYAALVTASHHLKLHRLGVVGAVVMHDM